MVSIEVENLSLSYPLRLRRLANLRPEPESRIRIHQHSVELNALRDVCFSLGAGDRVGVVGSNGSGKTTLLKVLHGIYRPTSGAVYVEGRTDAMFNVALGFRSEATGRMRRRPCCLTYRVLHASTAMPSPIRYWVRP